MQQAAAYNQPPAAGRDWARSLPLYAASLVVTLAGVGAVGMTLSGPAWLPIWSLITVLGHGASILLRRLGVSIEAIFYPVMLLGSAVVLQQAVMGSPVVGMEAPLGGLTMDMATATIVAMLSVVRCFTLVTDSALLFSPVPAITMLALVGSSNPNAEVPIFFGLLLLGSLFITGYEAHLRRVERRGVAAAPVTLYLFSAWGVTLAVIVGAVLFPLLVQPVLGPLSPFALPAVNRLRMMANFTQAPQHQAPVGQGPITLSRAPVYEVYAPETGRFRTGVLSHYTGREWTNEGQSPPQDKPSDGEAALERPGLAVPADIEAVGYRFQFSSDPDRTEPVPTREVKQRIVTVGYAPAGIPALGRIRELLYPRRAVLRYGNGVVTGNYHIAPGRGFEVLSEIPEFNDADLRRAPRVDPERFDPETLDLPQSAAPVRDLARRIAAEHPAAIDRVRAFMRHIEETCTYSLMEDVTPQGEDAAAHYLFNSKRGACDLAATALAVMCRSVGIPARVAVGYNGGEPLPNGGYLLRQEHAHMWTEAFFPGYGWVPFDPAPPLSETKDSFWSQASYRMRQVLGGIGGGGLDALLLVIVVVGTAVLGLYAAFKWLLARWERAARRRLEDGPGAAVARLYDRALKVLARRGWPRDAALTPQEYLDALRAEWNEHPEALAALQRLTAVFERSFYGGATSPGASREAEEAVRDLQRLAPRRPRAPRPAPVPVEGTA